MDIIKFGSIAIILSITVMVVKSVSKTYAQYVGVGAVVVLLFILLDNVFLIWQKVMEMSENLAGGQELIKRSLKVIGVSYVAEITAGICEQCESQSIANKVRYFGKISVFLSIFPMITTFLQGVMSLL